MGFSHVLVNTRDLGWYTRWDRDHRLERWVNQFDATKAGYLTVEMSSGQSTLYRVTDGPTVR
jgi:hypothetical protein